MRIGQRIYLFKFYRYFLFFGIFVSSFVQTFSQIPITLQELSPFDEGQNQLKRFFFPINPNQPYEGAIDPKDYFVGPNDIFTISIGGIKPQIEQIPVSVEGVLVLVGRKGIETKGKSLAQVIAEAEASLKRLFPNDPIDVKLAQPRSFYVHVIGAVPKTGRMTATPMSRLTDIATKALNEKNPEQKDILWEFRPSIRNIRIKKKNGQEASYDLYRYFQLGDRSHNPYLLDDDEIIFEANHIINDIINVQGEIPFPGPYPYRSGDNLLEILRLASGSYDLEKLGVVRVTKRNPRGAIQSENYRISEILSGQQQNPSLQAQDFVYVLDSGYEKGYVYLEGEVQYPGPYLVEGKETTLKEIIGMAGGLQDNALLRAAYIERNQDLERTDSPFQLPKSQNQLALTEKGRLSDLDIASRIYLERELVMSNRLAVNLNEALQENAPDIFLSVGDRLVIPKDKKKVNIIGEVKLRGFLDFVPNQSAEVYVLKAGGKGPNATKTYVIDGATGQLFLPEETQIKSGDTIFVDRANVYDTIELQNLAFQKQNAKTQRINTILSIVSSAVLVTSLVLSQRN